MPTAPPEVQLIPTPKPSPPSIWLKPVNVATAVPPGMMRMRVPLSWRPPSIMSTACGAAAQEVVLRWLAVATL